MTLKLPLTIGTSLLSKAKFCLLTTIFSFACGFTSGYIAATIEYTENTHEEIIYTN